jgi:cation diffusion facilitator CzcD-associated flavoprotein CzcO
VPEPRIVIIGAGFGGIAAGALLRRAGFTGITILERADAIGGVWRDNVYPGCACDIPAPLYSFSFAPNPDWSRRFPPRTEILDYLRRCVAEFGLTEAVRIGAEVTEARWVDGAWRIACADGLTYRADILIPAVGQLSRPARPDLPGATTFAGPAVHTAQWDPALDVAGRRVGVIGTGASAVQLVPEIAGRAAHITVFQRTAPWLLPKPDRRYGRIRRGLSRRIPALPRLARAGTWSLTVVTGRALLGGRIAHATVRALSRGQMRWQARDPALRTAVRPHYPFGCKRVVFSHDWLPTLRRRDVTLVTAPVAAVEPNGVRTADGAVHRCDILVYGTGFRATEFLVPMRVVGSGGRLLADEWRGGAYAHLGLTVPGFPNMFLMYGPNTNTGNTSVIYFHESQARYIVEAVRLIADGRILDVRPDVARAYDADLQRRLAGSVWVGCDSCTAPRAAGSSPTGPDRPASTAGVRRGSAWTTTADAPSCRRHRRRPNVSRKSASVTENAGRRPRR